MYDTVKYNLLNNYNMTEKQVIFDQKLNVLENIEIVYVNKAVRLKPKQDHTFLRSF